MCQEDSAQHTDTVPIDTVPATLLSSVGPYPASGGNSAVCPLYVSLPFEMANEPEMDLKLKWFNLNVAAGGVSEAKIDCQNGQECGMRLAEISWLMKNVDIMLII